MNEENKPVLARKWVEFQENNDHETVLLLKPTFIDDFLNKTGEQAKRGWLAEGLCEVLLVGKQENRNL